MPVLAHRLALDPQARFSGVTAARRSSRRSSRRCPSRRERCVPARSPTGSSASAARRLVMQHWLAPAPHAGGPPRRSAALVAAAVVGLNTRLDRRLPGVHLPASRCWPSPRSARAWPVRPRAQRAPRGCRASAPRASRSPTASCVRNHGPRADARPRRCSRTSPIRGPRCAEFVATREPDEERRNWFDRTVGYPRWAWLVGSATARGDRASSPLPRAAAGRARSEVRVEAVRRSAAACSASRA